MAVKLEKGTALGTLSITPLIDVVFLLLIFFLVATRFKEEAHELDIPLPTASEAKPLSKKPQSVIVNIDKDGSYYVERLTMDEKGLEQKLRQKAAQNLHQPVHVRGHKQCDYEKAVAVVNLCKKVGFDDIRLETEATKQ